MQQFLDFPRLPEWTGFFKSIEVVGPKQPMQLGKGDMVRVDFGGMTMNAPIVVCPDNSKLRRKCEELIECIIGELSSLVQVVRRLEIHLPWRPLV